MKIGIDARSYGDMGIGRYTSNLVRELEKLDTENEYIIFITKEGSDKYHPSNPRFKKWVVDYPFYSIQEQTLFTIDLLRARLDLLHIPHFNVPFLYYRPFVMTIHDLTMHDFGDKSATTLPLPIFMIKQVVYRVLVNIMAIRSKKILVPTETVKSELELRLKFFKPNKIEVATEGVDERLFEHLPDTEGQLKTRLEEMGIIDKYFLYVGSSFPHKNLNSLIVAYRDLRSKYNVKMQLVMAGVINKFSERLAGFAHALKLDGKVVFAARYSPGGESVTDKDLAYLYKGAMVYVSPSLKEGFSITPLEAQAFGVPVLLSDIPTHKEVFGDSVLYFDAKSTIELSEKMQEMVQNEKLREELIKKGYENVKRYSWKKMAQKTLIVYKEERG